MSHEEYRRHPTALVLSTPNQPNPLPCTLADVEAGPPSPTARGDAIRAPPGLKADAIRSLWKIGKAPQTQGPGRQQRTADGPS